MSTIKVHRVAGAFVAGFLLSAAGTSFAQDAKPETVVVTAQRHHWVDSALATSQQEQNGAALSNVNAGN